MSAYLGNALHIDSVKYKIDSNQRLPNYKNMESSFVSIRRPSQMYKDHINLKDWQTDLLNRVLDKGDIKRIYVFEKYGVNSFWIITTDSSVKNILNYSKEYTNTLERYQEINCDFMVFSEDEIDEGNIPDDAVIFTMRESINA